MIAGGLQPCVRRHQERAVDDIQGPQSANGVAAVVRAEQERRGCLAAAHEQAVRALSLGGISFEVSSGTDVVRVPDPAAEVDVELIG